MKYSYVSPITEKTEGRHNMIYKIRAHHGMCFAFFRGKGYSGAFTQNMWEMKEKLNENPEIVLLLGADDVCACCPNNQNGKCISADSGLSSGKAEAYDRQVLACCGLREGMTMRWKDFAESVRTHILVPGKREKICGDCEWSELCR